MTDSNMCMSNGNDNLDSDGMSRRGFLERTGAAGAGVVGASYMGSHAYGGPVEDAQAIAPAVAGIYVGPAGFGAGLAASNLLGDKEEEVEELREQNANILWLTAYSRARFSERYHKDTLRELDSIVTALDALTFANAAFEIADRTEAGDTAGQVEESAKNVVAEDVAEVQRRIASAYVTTVVEGVGEYIEEINSNENLSTSSVYGSSGLQSDGDVETRDSLDSRLRDDLIDLAEGDFSTHSTELVDGSTVSVPVIRGTDSGTIVDNYNYEMTLRKQTLEDIHAYQDGNTDSSSFDNSRDLLTGIRVFAPNNIDSNEVYDAFDVLPWLELFEDLEQIYESQLTMVENLVDNLYDPIRNGEVDASDIASGRAIIQQADQADDPNQLAGFYRAIRMPEAGTRAALEFSNGMRAEGYLFRTNEDETLPVGEEIDPDLELGEIHAAYEIKELPDEVPDDGEKDVDVRVLDEELMPEESAYVSLQGLDIDGTTDNEGWVTLTGVPFGSHNVRVVTSDDDINDPTQSTITRTTIVVDEDTSDVEIEADGSDDRAGDSVLSADDVDVVGDMVADRLTAPFTIIDTDDGVSEIEFEGRGLPDAETDDPEDIVEDGEETREERQRTREERDDLLDDMESGFGGDLDGIPGFDEAPLLWLSGGIIFVAIGSAVMSG